MMKSQSANTTMTDCHRQPRRQAKPRLYTSTQHLFIVLSSLRGMVIYLMLLSVATSGLAQPNNPFHFNGRATGLFALVNEDYSPQNTNLQRMNLQLNLGWQSNSRLSGYASVNNLLFTGKWLTDYSGYSYLSFNRYDRFDLTNIWHDDDRMMALSRLDRAWIEYAGKNFDLRLGRQLIGWGQTLIWNISDIFNTYSLLEIDRMPRQGTDAIRLTMYPSTSSVFEVAATLNNYNELTAASMFRHSFRGIDLQWQAGMVESSHWMSGGGFSTHKGLTVLRGEYGLYIPRKTHPTKKNIWIVSLGADHVFRNKLILQGEVLYNQLHFEETAGPLTRLYRSHSTPYMLSFSTWSLSVNAIYQVRDRIRLALITAALADDRFIMISPSILWHFTQNTELSAEGHTIALDYQNNRRHIHTAMLRITHRF